MGVCLSLVLDKKIPGAEFQHDGKGLFRMVDAFSEFIYDPMHQEPDEDDWDDDEDEDEIEDEPWQKAQDGLCVITALIAALQKLPPKGWKGRLREITMPSGRAGKIAR